MRYGGQEIGEIAACRRFRLFFCCLLPSVCCHLLVAADESVDAAVSGLQKRYAAVKTIKADFRQTYRAPGINQIESGVFWMKKPGLMRWEYRDPETKLFVADGHETFLYLPEERQVTVSSFSASEMHSTPLRFLLGQGDIAASFKVSRETELKPIVQGTVMLRLVPRTQESDYGYIVLELDSKTSDVRRMVIREQTGNTSEFLFTNMETNVAAEDKLFHFKVPKGVEVIRLEEKN